MLRKRGFLIIAVLCVSLLFSVRLEAQEATFGSLFFWVRDSQTGYGIHARGEFRRQDQPGAILTTDDSGRLTFSSAPGIYEVRVEAQGYRPLRSYFGIEPGKGFEVEVLLDPLQPAPELRPEQLESLLAGGTVAVFHGYIVHKQTAKPIGGVRVEARTAGVVGWSDARGYFSIQIPTSFRPNTETPPPDRNSSIRERGVQNIHIAEHFRDTWGRPVSGGSGTWRRGNHSTETPQIAVAARGAANGARIEPAEGGKRAPTWLRSLRGHSPA